MLDFIHGKRGTKKAFRKRLIIMKGHETITRAILIYDGDCPVCAKTIEWIGQNARREMFEMLPCQSDDVRERFPSMEQAVCMEAMQLVLSDGTVLSGEKALPEIVKRLKRYRAAADIFKLPGSEILSRAFYRWFADKRYHIARLFFNDTNKKKK